MSAVQYSELTTDEMIDPQGHLIRAKKKIERLEGYVKTLLEQLEDQDRAMSKGVSGLLHYVDGMDVGCDELSDKIIEFRPQLPFIRIPRAVIFEMKHPANIERWMESEAYIWARKVLKTLWSQANPQIVRD